MFVSTVVCSSILKINENLNDTCCLRIDSNEEKQDVTDLPSRPQL